MGIKVKHLVIVAAALALACGSMAQGGGGGGGQGRGGFGQGRGMGMGGPLQLLNIKEVQDELKLSADQLTKVKDLQTKERDARQKAMEDARASGTFDREAMAKLNQKIADDTTKELAKILAADQTKRLRELTIQRAGNGALMMPDVQKELALTTEQKASIKSLQEKQQAANMELFQKMRNQELTREEGMAALQKNNEAMNGELAKLLTADQTKKFKDMQGKPFKFPVRPNGPGGPGGGGRGGGGG